ncbi:hypothetical protein D9758_005685 [Tetrapyrgos nigripes]|uniref:Proteasome subunit beta n=1 Tax=Tetrapyrgos nigripes TaxID=182062 RepID=A0A8H5LQH8_9AGAR|nr:hypothetical protein D9758_005685 [Tetrapyrgos nigripes]
MPDMVPLDHAGPQQRQFNPYSDNGGTILAIAGADFSVIAGDTRQSEGYNIQTRYAPKVFRLTDKAVLAVNGFAADGNMFVKRVRQRLEIYFKNQTAAPGTTHPKHLPLQDVLGLVIDSFTGATERHIEVGDGLEIYIVFAKGSPLQGLENVPNVQEMTMTSDGERMFIIRRELKKD